MRDADRLFSSALASGRGDVRLWSAFWLAKQHGMEVGAPPEKVCKNTMHARAPFLTQARVPYNTEPEVEEPVQCVGYRHPLRHAGRGKSMAAHARRGAPAGEGGVHERPETVRGSVPE